QYRRFVELVDSHLPAPPRAWADLSIEMERLDGAKTYRVRPIWMSAVAAAVLLAVLILPHPGSVARAETLLTRAKAAADRIPSRKRSRLRVGTRHASFERPAVGADVVAGNEPLRAQFLAARYDWNDPLSAAAFRGWREQLRQRSDHVSETR